MLPATKPLNNIRLLHVDYPHLNEIVQAAKQ